MDFQNEMNYLKKLLNLTNSNQDPLFDLYDLKRSDEGDIEINSLTKEPLDTLLMGDEVISTILEMENDEFKMAPLLGKVYTPSATPLSELNRRELITQMIEFNKIQEQVIMDFQNEMNCLKKMLNLTNSNQDPPVDLYDLKRSDEGDNKINSFNKEPLDTLLMRDDVIITILKRENDKFIKSSADDLVPIPRESKVTSVYDDLECDMPVTIPLPTSDVREEVFDINSPLGEYVVDFLMENEDVASLPRHLVKYLFNHLLKNLSLTKGMSDEPL
ncbi:hypothetical protein Tco_1065429, partial [Tanacetum coccineum]